MKLASLHFAKVTIVTYLNTCLCDIYNVYFFLLLHIAIPNIHFNENDSSPVLEMRPPFRIECLFKTEVYIKNWDKKIYLWALFSWHPGIVFSVNLLKCYPITHHELLDNWIVLCFSNCISCSCKHFFFSHLVCIFCCYCKWNRICAANGNTSHHGTWLFV